MAYDNTNTGALFRNEKKETDNHPDYTGSVNIDGVDYWQSAWVKTSKAGKKFFSQSFKPKEATSKPRADEPPPPPEFDDDLPF